MIEPESKINYSEGETREILHLLENENENPKYQQTHLTLEELQSTYCLSLTEVVIYSHCLSFGRHSGECYISYYYFSFLKLSPKEFVIALKNLEKKKLIKLQEGFFDHEVLYEKSPQNLSFYFFLPLVNEKKWKELIKDSKILN